MKWFKATLRVGRYSILVLLIFISSVAVRTDTVTQHFYGIEQDEIEWSAIPILQSAGLDPVVFGVWSRQVFSSKIYPISTGLLSLAYGLLGKNIYSARVCLVFLLSFSCVPFFLLIRKIGSKFSALASLLLFAFSSYYLSLGLVAEQPPFIPVFYICTLTFLGFFVFPSDRPVTVKNLTLYAFFVSFFSVATMLTYNQNFLLPFILIGTLLLSLVINPTRWRAGKKAIFIALAIPYIFFGKHLVDSFLSELPQRYALENSAISRVGGTYLVDFAQIQKNTQAFMVVLVDRIGVDMVIQHNHPLVPKLVLVLCVFGLMFSLVRFNRYYFIFPLLVQVIIQHMVLGLNLPRMMINTVILIYILCALGLYSLECRFLWLKKKWPSRLTNLDVGTKILLVAILLTTLWGERQVYLTESTKNYTYQRGWERLYAVLRTVNLENTELYLESKDLILISTLYPMAWVEQGRPINSNEIADSVLTVNRFNRKNYPRLLREDPDGCVKMYSGRNVDKTQALVFSMCED